jgi:hypothetical protein
MAFIAQVGMRVITSAVNDHFQAPAALYQVKQPPMPTGHEAG